MIIPNIQSGLSLHRVPVPVFNAALVIYSGLLIQAHADDHHWLFSLGNSEIRRDLLYQAVDSLMALDYGNMRAEKCAQYILRLDRVLDSPCKYPSRNLPMSFPFF